MLPAALLLSLVPLPATSPTGHPPIAAAPIAAAPTATGRIDGPLAQEDPPGAEPGSGAPRLELVETAPVGTTLDAPDLREAHEVWIEAFDGARESIELAHFYASDAGPDGGSPERSTRLSAVVAALERAVARGVALRLLLSANFRDTYPALATRLAALPGVELRWLDLRGRTGGVLHAKTLLVDRRLVFVGSQNFDWRALEHIQELGVRVDDPAVAAAFGRVFDLDWRLAAEAMDGPAPDAGLDADARAPGTGARDGEAPGSGSPAMLDPGATSIDGARVTPVFSPLALLPAGLEWDLPHLLRLIDGAERTVRVQLLSYSPTDRDGGWFGDLDSALRRAAARGVDVRLTVADWGKRRGRVEWLQSLEPVPDLEVRMVTLPEAAEGFIPFARCVHAKYLVVDADAAWVGTSNWSGDYFHASRNAGLVIEGGALPERLDRFHADTWNSPYAYTVDPGAEYVPPRIGD